MTKPRHDADLLHSSGGYSQHLRSAYVQHLVHNLGSGHPELVPSGAGHHLAAPWMLDCHLSVDPAQKLLQVKNMTMAKTPPNTTLRVTYIVATAVMAIKVLQSHHSFRWEKISLIIYWKVLRCSRIVSAATYLLCTYA